MAYGQTSISMNDADSGRTLQLKRLLRLYFKFVHRRVDGAQDHTREEVVALSVVFGAPTDLNHGSITH
jgi:hypothetical protein